jgi:hypothetical protein
MHWTQLNHEARLTRDQKSVLTVKQTVRKMDVSGIVYDSEPVDYYLDDHVGVWDVASNSISMPVSIADYYNPVSERLLESNSMTYISNLACDYAPVEEALDWCVPSVTAVASCAALLVTSERCLGGLGWSSLIVPASIEQPIHDSWRVCPPALFELKQQVAHVGGERVRLAEPPHLPRLAAQHRHGRRVRQGVVGDLVDALVLARQLDVLLHPRRGQVLRSPRRAGGSVSTNVLSSSVRVHPRTHSPSEEQWRRTGDYGLRAGPAGEIVWFPSVWSVCGPGGRMVPVRRRRQTD